MIKMYRYIIYRLYSWRLRKKDDSPVSTIIYLLSGVHLFQLMSVYCILAAIFNLPYIMDMMGKGYLLLFTFAFAGLNYLTLYNKKRWESYIEEFKDETPEEKRRGQFLVVGYLLGSVLLLFILLPVLFGK